MRWVAGDIDLAAPIAAVLGQQPLGDEVFAAATRTATALVPKFGLHWSFPGAARVSLIDQTVKSEYPRRISLSGDATTVVIRDGETTRW
jgi:hypothetical protein